MLLDGDDLVAANRAVVVSGDDALACSLDEDPLVAAHQTSMIVFDDLLQIALGVDADLLLGLPRFALDAECGGLRDLHGMCDQALYRSTPITALPRASVRSAFEDWTHQWLMTLPHHRPPSLSGLMPTFSVERGCRTTRPSPRS